MRHTDRALAAAPIHRLIGFETRIQLDAFLKNHEIYGYTASDFEHDREILRQLRMRESPH